MRFDLQTDDILRRSSLIAIPEEYDAYPRPDRLLLEWVPRAQISADRLLLAGVLAFSDSCSGKVGLMNQAAVSAPLDEAISRFYSGRSVRCSEVNLRPQDAIRGASAFVFRAYGEDAPSTQWNGFDDYRELGLEILDSTEVSGASFSSNVFRIPSNARWMQNARRGKPLFCALAVGLLMSHEYEVAEFIVGNDVRESLEERSVVELLKAVGISVRFR